VSVLVTDFNKVNVVVKANLTLEQATKAQMGVEVRLYTFFNFGARCGGRLKSRPARFTPGKRSDTHCTGGCVGPRTVLGGCGISCLPPGFDPRTFQPVASRYTN
jgi:hypothetical protein